MTESPTKKARLDNDVLHDTKKEIEKWKEMQKEYMIMFKNDDLEKQIKKLTEEQKKFCQAVDNKGRENDRVLHSIYNNAKFSWIAKNQIRISGEYQIPQLEDYHIVIYNDGNTEWFVAKTRSDAEPTEAFKVVLQEFKMPYIIIQQKLYAEKKAELKNYLHNPVLQMLNLAKQTTMKNGANVENCLEEWISLLRQDKK